MRIDEAKATTDRDVLPDHSFEKFRFASADRTEHVYMPRSLLIGQNDRAAVVRMADLQHHRVPSPLFFDMKA